MNIDAEFDSWWKVNGIERATIHERCAALKGWRAARSLQQETFVADVRKFAEAAGHTTDEFNVRQTALYIGLQCEELAEKFCAIFDNDAIASNLTTMSTLFKSGMFDRLIAEADREEMLDADVDLAWVTIGSMLSQGSDVTGAMNEVVRSNMSKMVEGKMVKDANGKVVKPDTYSPPNLLPFVKNV